MIHEDALTNFRRYVGEAFKNGMQLFPNYTLHGTDHLEEVDRLAKLLATNANLDEERLGLLRLAVIMHDFAMVDIPDPKREVELRRQMSPELSFADIVRRVHQDEIEKSFSNSERIEYITRLFSGVPPFQIEEACTIARHHRFNHLSKAPPHLKGLCALMRIADELDIGPKRAPVATYEALRTRMDSMSMFHWLKHMCSRPIEDETTFTVELRGKNLRVLKVWVAVKATESSWKCIQDAIVEKINICLDNEGVNDALRQAFRVEIHVAPAESYMCGTTPFLSHIIREDLKSVIEPGSHKSAAIVPVAPQPVASPVSLIAPSCDDILQKAAAGNKSELVIRSNATEDLSPTQLPRISSGTHFVIRAIPPEKLTEVLCQSGRLTVARNKYIKPEEEHIGGTENAPSRIFVGPADCGKTRAASEWITNLTAAQASQWVILRTEYGSIPDNIEHIFIDTTLYEENHYHLPQKAILFLDDLPGNLPPLNSTSTGTDAVRRLFGWFNKLPYFREHRVIGTIRLEDMHAQPQWPGVLPSLGNELELIRLLPLSISQYRDLWAGMSKGIYSATASTGVKSFALDLTKQFVDEVSQRHADPEAVATFIQQMVAKHEKRLDAHDASRFYLSAVDIWLRETWPALLNAYGIAGRVFFTIARFLEAGSRPKSGFKGSLPPAWEYHKGFGPDLCRQFDEKNNYLKIIDQIGRDGHAVGQANEWIRPKFDFLLQSDDLPGVEFPLPNYDWFAERSRRLEPKNRRLLAFHFSTADVELKNAPSDDLYWACGWAVGKLMASELENNTTKKKELRDHAVELLRNALSKKPDYSEGWNDLGTGLGKMAESETNATTKVALQDEAISAFRQAVAADAKNIQALSNLGISLGRKAEAETDTTTAAGLLNEAITMFRKASAADANNCQAWSNLGVCLGRKAEAETDITLAAGLHDEAIAASRQAVAIDAKSSQAWSNLGVRLGQKAETETDATSKALLKDEAIAAYRKAVSADPGNSVPWFNLGISLSQKAAVVTDAPTKIVLQDESITAYQQVVKVNPNNGPAWYNLVGQLTSRFRSLGKRQDIEYAIECGRKAVAAINKHYNLACALALGKQHDIAFRELQISLERNEISKAHLAGDPDWEHLRDDPRFKQLTQP